VSEDRKSDKLQSYKGSCHCGRVTFEARARLDYVVECNCSICRRKGAVWHGATDTNLRILTGEADLALYQFNTKTAKHYFCTHCGVSPFSRPRIDPSRWVFNVRCIDGVDLSALTVRPFDGVNWEATAKAYLERGR
jgi:hypothetical protein